MADHDHSRPPRAADLTLVRVEEKIDQVRDDLHRFGEVLDVTRQWAAGHEASCEKDREAADKRWRQMETTLGEISGKLEALQIARTRNLAERAAWKQMAKAASAVVGMLGTVAAGAYWLYQHVTLRAAVLLGSAALAGVV